MRVRTTVKAGAMNCGGLCQHNATQVRAGLNVRTGVKAGALSGNHNAAQVRVTPNLTVKTGVKAGTCITPQHNATHVRACLNVRTGAKAGGIKYNHNATQVRR